MIEIGNLTKAYEGAEPGVAAVEDVSLRIGGGEFFTLLGPSGCGKSTLLRCVAGLEIPDAGRISIDGNVVFDSAAGVNLPPNRRRIGMVFQSYAVWPHMTVYQNVAFPLQVQRMTDIPARVRRALEMVGLEDFADRYAPKLSGGQQQRVALARAIVAEPQVLLLDEPLSNLDAALREQMRSELRNLQRDLHVTSLYVTHDQAEALSMSDQIAVMRAGHVLEVADPETLYRQPTHAFSAEFLGSANVLAGACVEARDAGGYARVRTPIGVLATAAEVAPGADVLLFIRPECVTVAPAQAPDDSTPNVFAATVRDRQFIGDTVELSLDLEGTGVLRCKTPSRDGPGIGARIAVRVDPGDLHVLGRG